MANMDIDKAETSLKGMAHSEQHYFNRWVDPLYMCFLQPGAFALALSAECAWHRYSIERTLG